MKNINVKFQIVVSVLLIISCANNYQATDYVKDNTFTSGVEGPAVDKFGNLYAVNFQEEGTIGIIKNNKASLFVKLPKNSIGNGIRFDSKGYMYVADYTNHNILKIDPKTKKIIVFAHDSAMNQPNDIAISDDNTLYASDPNWKESTGNIWKIDTNGVVTRLEKNMSTTNGIEVDVTNKLLYVNESVVRKVWVYNLDNNGNINNKRLFAEFKDFGLDGMRSDKEGNIYIARYGKGVVAKFSKEGKLLLEVKLKGKFPTNVAFGGDDGKTVFVTMQKRGAIEKFTVETPGRVWK